MIGLRSIGGVVGLMIALISTIHADEDLTIPIDDGSGIEQGLRVRAKFVSEYSTLFGPERCLSAWCVSYFVERYGRGDMLEHPLDVRFQFDAGGLCKGKPQQWSTAVGGNLTHLFASMNDWFPLEDADGCTVEKLKVSLLLVEIDGKILVSNDIPDVDFTRELKAIQAQKYREAVRQKQTEVEQKQRELAEKAKAAEQKRQLTASCSEVYKNTIDKKVRDLTVREEQQVRACQALGLYPPQ